jgi:hypothetical protein
MLIAIMILSTLIFSSVSRAAIFLAFFSILYYVFILQRFRIKKILPFFAIICLVYFFLFNSDFIEIPLSTSALDFFRGKLSAAENDLVETRFYYINIDPILKYFNEFSFVELLIGNGLNVQHSWISNSLIMTGIIGFIIYLKRFTIGLKKSILSISKLSLDVERSFTLLFLLIILINDFITNLTLVLPFAGYTSYVILGFLMAKNDYRV